MPQPHARSQNDDPHNLARFLDAQEADFDRALSEIKAGQKRTHWMWYIFPQFRGLAFSSTSQFYAITSPAEAKAFLSHPVLGERLLACAEAVLNVQGRSAAEIFGSPDDLKLKSSASLFAQVSPVGSAFHRILDKYYNGAPDARTLELIGKTPATTSSKAAPATTTSIAASATMSSSAMPETSRSMPPPTTTLSP